MAVILIHTSNLLVMGSNVEVERPDSLKIEFVNHTISLTQNMVLNDPDVLIIAANLLITQSVSESTVFRRSNLHDITFFSNVYRDKGLHFANSNLQLSHKATSADFVTANSVLTISQTLVGSRSFSQILSLTQALGLNIVDAVTITQNPGLISAVSVFKENNPQLINIPVPVFPSSPSNVILTFGTKTMTLRPPILGDMNSLEHAKINRRTRGGELIVFRDPSWPRTEKLHYRFENVSEKSAKDFLEFVDASLGQDITLTDYEGFNWTGIIVNPESIIEQIMRGKHYECDLPFAFDLEFQGEQQ